MISGSWICPQGNGPALSQLERIRLPRLSQQWSTTKECWCCLVVGPILRHSRCIRYINHFTLLVPYEQFEIKVIWDNYFKLYVLHTALCLLSQEKFLECNTLYVLQTIIFYDLRRNPLNVINSLFCRPDTFCNLRRNPFNVIKQTKELPGSSRPNFKYQTQKNHIVSLNHK